METTTTPIAPWVTQTIRRLVDEVPKRRRVRLWIVPGVDVKNSAPFGWPLDEANRQIADLVPGCVRTQGPLTFPCFPGWESVVLGATIIVAQRYGWRVDSQTATEAVLSKEMD